MGMDNYASYQPGTFTISVSRFEIGERLFQDADMPAFLHEYCHYIQDISTISSVFGFSLWMLDLVNLTQIFSDGEGKTIFLPLPKDANGNPVNQYRKFYSLFCGDPNDVFSLDYNLVRFKNIDPQDETLELTNWSPQIRLNKIVMENRVEPIHFRLIALQEIHAFYAQQLSEISYKAKNPTVEFTIYANGLPSYPYRFGDHLFEVFEVNIPLQAKLILTGLCLDTIQAPTVFLMVLEDIKGKTFSLERESIDELRSFVENARQNCSYSNEEAMAQIMPDLENWAKDMRRPDLAIALEWYTTMVKLAFDFKQSVPIGFNGFFCQGIGGLSVLYQAFPAPLFYNYGALDGNKAADGSSAQDLIYHLNHEAASSFWILRKLYDFLCSPDINSLSDKCECPLYEKCIVRPTLGEDDVCKRSPWEIVKNKDKVPCLYGRAAASMGLWQNEIDFVFN